MIGPWFSETTTPEAPDGRRVADVEWRGLVRHRVVVVLVVLAAWGATIQARLLQVQVIRHETYFALALSQQEGQIPIKANRGDIVDRHGNLLAYSVGAWRFDADPSLMEEPEKAVGLVCEALTDCSTSERHDLAGKFQRDTRWVPIRQASRVSPLQVERLRALNLPWVILTEESKRYYPSRELASHVLGFVGAENRGLHGLEARLDDVVGGQPGVMNIRRDARFNRLLTEVRQPAVAGASVELTIDETLQYIVERELLAGIIEANAVGGAVVMLEPETGAILAMTSYPTFNPNDYASAADEIWRNRATQDVYEPGSTFKIVTASAAIEDGLYAPDDIIDIQYGRLFVPGRGRLVTDDHASATLLTFEDVIVKSSNVGAVLIGQKAGKERITRYAQRFGFGQRLAPDFAGESAGRVYAAGDLTENGLASMSMGYQVSVTALQMASAMNTIANGGRLMEPQLVRAITRDGVREEVAPKALRQAIRPETAATLTGFLENVVSRGTARAAQPEGFQAAGKTGTTKKAVPGGYSETDRVSSFVGFAPSRQPAFTILVMIDTPRNGQVYGGAVAAPVFKRIAEAALRRAGTTPTRNAEPPVVITAAADRARAEVWPVSIERTTLDLGSEPTMPDLRGLSARDAAAILRELGLEFRIAGAGTVASQVPAPGEVIRPGDWGALQLRRGAARPGADTGGGRR